MAARPPRSRSSSASRTSSGERRQFPRAHIHFPAGTSAATRDRLVALLADYDLVAIQEDQIAAPTAWTAHFDSDEARIAAAGVLAIFASEHDLRVESIEVEDDDWARRTQADLPAIRVGRVIVAPPWDMPSRRWGRRRRRP